MIKKIIFATVFIIISLRGVSQNFIGIEAGTVVSSLNIKSNQENNSPKLRLGIKIGLNYLRNLNNSLDLESGIFYYQKGQNNEHETTGSSSGTSARFEYFEEYKLNYLEIPVSVKYNYNNFFISTGVYISYCFSGFYSEKKNTINAQTEELMNEYKTKSDLFKEDDDFFNPLFNDTRTAKRFDYGLKFGIGYRLGRFTVKSNFDLGFPFVVENKESSIFGFPTENYQNRALTLTLVYYFN
jgi:hypothetical protein